MAGLTDYFVPYIFSADFVARAKPHPALFLYAAEQMEAAPEECLVVEDSPTGISAARAAGMKVIGFSGGGHCGPDHAERLSGANAIISDMRELPATIQNVI
jgi:beta-phosphoglucomutase-like phosphatase (HAD superfamily)